MTDDVDEKKMPLLDHLVELRRRLAYSAAGLVVAFFACFYVSLDLFNFLVQPLADVFQGDPDAQMIFTALHEFFFTKVKVAAFAALFLTFPLIAGQLYMFVAPGLYKNEKSAFLPFLIVTPMLFFAGGAFVYYFVMPVAWAFFVDQGVPAGEGQIAINAVPKVGEYLSLVMQLIFAFGISFELPVVISLLAKAGMVTSAGLKKKRRYAVVLAFVAAAVLTPPDPLSQIGLALPIIFLYEISIICARLIEKKRGDDEELDDDDDDDDTDEEDDPDGTAIG
ncbi:MAG: twin-arginine translocase subunit TatC [Alphaproteobacteria bacterium]